MEADPGDAAGRGAGAPDPCDQEPIRSPALIQPHKALFCLESRTLRLLSRSTNAANFLPHEAETDTAGALVGEPWLAMLEADLRTAVSEGRTVERMLPAGSAGTLPLLFTVIPAGNTLFVEVETLLEADLRPAVELPSVAEIMAEMTVGMPTSAICRRVVEAIRGLTGMERVLIYRFEPDGHGLVVAETLADTGMASVADFHFPAADIPRQARALYLQSRARFTPRRDYEPAALEPALDPRDGKPFDLGRCPSRSLSPVHREYQRNLGVDGSFSLSLTDGCQLWGLVVGHHRLPRRVSVPARRAAEALAAALARHLIGEDAREDHALRLRHLASHRRLLEQLAGAEDFVTPLVEGEVGLLDLFPGVTGAAVIRETDSGLEVRGTGSLPPEPVVIACARHCRDRLTDSVFATVDLKRTLPEAAGHMNVAAGVLAIAIGETDRDVILWFRPETPVTQVWAGATPSTVSAEKARGNFYPRESFDRWIVEHRGQAESWPLWALEIARGLRATVNDVILRQTRLIRTLRHRAAQLADANRELSALSERLEADRRKLADDLALARTMQLGLLPGRERLETRASPLGLAVDAIFQPSAAIGGDLWGELAAPDGQIAFYLFDFSGHGVGAALNVFRLHTLLDDPALGDRDLAEILGQLNGTLCHLLPRGQYATVLLCRIDPRRQLLTWSAAGIPPPVLLRGGSRPEWLDSRGAPLGLRRSAEYRVRSIDFRPGDALFLYSDGLDEAVGRDGTPLGPEGVCRVLHRCRTGAGLVELDAALAEGGFLPLQDDLTAIQVGYLETASQA